MRRRRRSPGWPAGSCPRTILSRTSSSTCGPRSVWKRCRCFAARRTEWVAEATAGRAAPTTPDDGSETLDLGEEASLVIRGPRLPAEARRVLAAFVAQLSVAVRARTLEQEAEEAAELVEVNDLRAAILAAVSHDLRTPLASVKASVSSLRQRDVAWTDDEIEEFLATIEEETDRLTSLVGNLLECQPDPDRIAAAGAAAGRSGRGRAEGARESHRRRPRDRGRRAGNPAPRRRGRCVTGARDREHRRQRPNPEHRRRADRRSWAPP